MTARRALSDASLQLIFLLLATLILTLAMLLLGKLVSDQLSRSITDGVADTAAASLDVMLAHELAEIGPVRPLTGQATRDLDALFSAANDAPLNKLIQIRLRNPDGSLLYQSLGGLLDPSPTAAVAAAARSGSTTSTLIDLPLMPVGPLAAAPVPILKIVTPVHDRGSGAVIATAELYFGARNLIELEHGAQRSVWTMVAAIGLAVIAALFVLVNRAGTTISRQRRHLAASLGASERLAAENNALRQQANLANERLLAQVGADLHDGPLQLLAMVILKLSRRSRSHESAETALAQQAMEELRSISAGLVLPELSALALPEVIALGIRRHEEVTGSTVEAHLGEMPGEVSADLKVCIYRVLQEGLANAHRHGAPGTAAVAAQYRGGWLTLEITNGLEPASAGPQTRAPRAPPRLGLAGMRSRLDAIGGSLRFARTGSHARLVVAAPIGTAPAPQPAGGLEPAGR